MNHSMIALPCSCCHFAKITLHKEDRGCKFIPPMIVSQVPLNTHKGADYLNKLIINNIFQRLI